MSPAAISLIVFAVVFGGALAGMAIRSLLSERHLSADSKDAVKLVMGLIGTISALVLGLLIASAKSSYNDKISDIRQITAKIILIDDLLKQYGPEAVTARNLLRQGIDPMIERIWAEETSETEKLAPFEATAAAIAFLKEIGRLSPQDEVQRSLQARAIQAVNDFSQLRLSLFAQTGKSIPMPFLVILVFWLTAIFASLTLFARANLIVTVTMLIGALSVAGSIFLILELDRPFVGLMKISSTQLRNALPPIGS